MYNLCLLKIGDINITVSSLHPLRSIQQDLTQDVKQPDAIKYTHEVSNKIFFYMTRRISSDRNNFFDSPMIRDLPPNSQRTTTPVKMIFQLTDFILPSKVCQKIHLNQYSSHNYCIQGKSANMSYYQPLGSRIMYSIYCVNMVVHQVYRYICYINGRKGE